MSLCWNAFHSFFTAILIEKTKQKQQLFHFDLFPFTNFVFFFEQNIVGSFTNLNWQTGYANCNLLPLNYLAFYKFISNAFDKPLFTVRIKSVLLGFYLFIYKFDFFSFPVRNIEQEIVMFL